MQGLYFPVPHALPADPPRPKLRVGLLGDCEAGEKNAVQFYSNICNYSQAENKAQHKVFSNVGINEHVLSNIIQAPKCIYVRFPKIL